MQAGRLRREVGPRGVGAAHDQREARQRGLALQPEQLEHGVERAALAFVADLDALDVERHARRSRARPPAPAEDRRRECAPRASMKRRISHGQATRSIFGRRRVTHRLGAGREALQRRLGDERQTGLGPGLIAACQHAGGEPARPQIGRRHLAELCPALQASTTGRARSSAPHHWPRSPAWRHCAVGISAGRRVVDLAAAHVESCGACAVPISDQRSWGEIEIARKHGSPPLRRRRRLGLASLTGRPSQAPHPTLDEFHRPFKAGRLRPPLTIRRSRESARVGRLPKLGAAASRRRRNAMPNKIDLAGRERGRHRRRAGDRAGDRRAVPRFRRSAWRSGTATRRLRDEDRRRS